VEFLVEADHGQIICQHLFLCDFKSALAIGNIVQDGPPRVVDHDVERREIALQLYDEDIHVPLFTDVTYDGGCPL
jgi:hypothetical protein